EETLCDSAVTVLMGEVVSNENINQDRPLQLFPNPTANELTVQLPNALNEQVELSILSIDGRMLLRQQYNGFLRETLDVSTFPAGVYMLQFRTATNLTTRKVIVE
ncbi:MAG: T9SS type A sorting domain-containing protein, partial [Bacteroidota bacterium]